MRRTSSIVAGLETGTSKVCVTVGEVSGDGSVRVLGVGQSKSRGVRKGEIVDSSAAAEDIREAIVEAETSADVEITSLFLGVTGNHMVGLNSHATHPIVSEGRVITEEDVQEVIKNAKIISLPHENSVVHIVRQHFTVNGQSGIVNPAGMVANAVEADVHIFHGNYNRIQSAIHLVKGLQFEVEDVVFNGIASSLSVLTHEQKELGTLVLDLGAGCSEYVAYSKGIIKHSGVLAVGGDHVSNDLAYGLKVPLGRAEQLKIDHGCAFVDPSTHSGMLELPSDVGLPPRSVNLEHLARIMSMRLEETLELIEQDLSSTGVMDYLRGGVVLTGGASRVPGLDTLAARIFRMNVYRGRPSTLEGLPSNLQQAEFATPLGLLKFGAFRMGPRPAWAERVKDRLKRFVFGRA